MDFLNLPVEIGSKIFNYLDTKSQINVYNSCDVFRKYFSSWCRLLKVVLSRSTLATAKTLDEKLLLDLGQHVTELNLSGVPDLTVDNLKQHMKRFVNLVSLDVTFTNIYLSDISVICPQNLKKIGINYFKDAGNFKCHSIIEESKEVFKEKQFEAVHFVIMELSCTASPLIFLKDVHSIKNLKLTVSDNYKEFLNVNYEETVTDLEIEINFDKLTLLARDCAVTHKLSKQLDGVTRLNFKQLEYIFMMYLERIEIYVSPLLANLFTVCCRDLHIEVSSYLPLNFMLDGNIAFLAWNKATTTFDEGFYKDLLVELQDYFPTYFCMHSNCIMKITEAPSSWFCIDKCENFEKLPDLPEKVTLTDFCRKDGVVVRCRHPISLSMACKSLQHLTFLRMNNVPIRNKFFNVLFQQCPVLTTLDVYMENRGTIRSYTQSLSKSFHLAKLKNFMLTSEDVQYEIIFGILCSCPSLENVHICEYEREASDKAINVRNILLFIEKSINLYSLFIEADLSAERLTMMMAPLRAMAQNLDRNYLNIEVCQSSWGWNPFADVFSPSNLHIFN